MQVEADLSVVNGRFLQLHGPAGGAELDLYGRAASLHPAPKAVGEGPPDTALSTAKSGERTGRIRCDFTFKTWLREPMHAPGWVLEEFQLVGLFMYTSAATTSFRLLRLLKGQVVAAWYPS